MKRICKKVALIACMLCTPIPLIACNGTAPTGEQKQNEVLLKSEGNITSKMKTRGGNATASFVIVTFEKVKTKTPQGKSAPQPEFYSKKLKITDEQYESLTLGEEVYAFYRKNSGELVSILKKTDADTNTPTP